MVNQTEREKEKFLKKIDGGSKLNEKEINKFEFMQELIFDGDELISKITLI
jgi:hypothetical protein